MLKDNLFLKPFPVVRPRLLVYNNIVVHYNVTKAPDSGQETVYAKCADNAHTRTGANLRVFCQSDGNWSEVTPECECDEGYQENNGILYEGLKFKTESELIKVPFLI